MLRLTKQGDAGLHPASSPPACSHCQMILQRGYQLRVCLQPKSALFHQCGDQQMPLGLSVPMCKAAKSHPNSVTAAG